MGELFASVLRWCPVSNNHIRAESFAGTSTTVKGVSTDRDIVINCTAYTGVRCGSTRI